MFRLVSEIFVQVKSLLQSHRPLRRSRGTHTLLNDKGHHQIWSRLQYAQPIGLVDQKPKGYGFITIGYVKSDRSVPIVARSLWEYLREDSSRMWRGGKVQLAASGLFRCQYG